MNIYEIYMDVYGHIKITYMDICGHIKTFMDI
jgi:hypothetical protein